MHDVFKRFAKVFEQTYIRFLDLQKSEAQAREAKIEAALERVRARTMAMQRSDELIEAASIMFQQVQALGAPSWACGYNIWDDDKKYTSTWNYGKDGIHTTFKVPTNQDVFLKFYEAEQRGEDFYVEAMGGKQNVLARHLPAEPVRRSRLHVCRTGSAFKDLRIVHRSGAGLGSQAHESGHCRQPFVAFMALTAVPSAETRSLLTGASGTATAPTMAASRQ